MTLNIIITNRTLIFHIIVAPYIYVCDLLDRVTIRGWNAYTVDISMALL
jgi:hypothetical protein